MLEDIENEDYSMGSFLHCVKECLSNRECKEYNEGVINKVHLMMYKMFSKEVEFKNLHKISKHTGKKVILNEELGRHRGRDGSRKCNLHVC